MDSGLKKRLLGAAVLIALAVIFVPMLLPSHSDSGQQSVSVKIPPEPNGEMQTRILKVGPDSAAAGSSTAAAIHDPDHVATLDLEKNPAARQAAAALPIAATNAPAEPAVSAPTSAVSARLAATAPPQASVHAEPAPVVAKAPAASTKETAAPPKPEPAPKAEPVAGGAGAAAGAVYTVNLGIYADHASANKLVANAKQHGFAAVATPETFQGKQVLRVHVGPFASRAQAEAARLKLKDFERVSMTIDSGAVNQRGDAPPAAIAAGQPGTWAVQLAAFGTEDAANKLRDRLRSQGFDGFVDSVSTAKGKLWRVRAGPYASRDTAMVTRDQIAQKLKVTGNVVTQ